MAVTAASLRASIRMSVEGAEPRNRPYQTPLTNAPGGAGTTFSVGDGDAFQVGDLVQTVTGELALVTAISTNDLTVTRATGTISAETLGSGDVVMKNPRFSVEQMDEAVDQILQELNPTIFALLTEDITYTVDDWYDVTDTAMEEVYSAWYIDEGDFHAPYFYFATDPDNVQPKVFVGSAGFTGTIHIVYRRPYAAVTELPDRVAPIVVNGAVYKLLGGAGVQATADPGKRTDRTTQGGQEFRDSYWFLREYTRLRDTERVYLQDKISRVPKHRISQRSRRFMK